MSGGSRVVVGRLQQRTWTAEDGRARPMVEVVAEELGRACAGDRSTRARQQQREQLGGSVGAIQDQARSAGEPW